MSKLKLTPWFPVSAQPVRNGLYQVKAIHDSQRWARWENGTWMCVARDKEMALETQSKSADMHVMDGEIKPKWRGVAK